MSACESTSEVVTTSNPGWRLSTSPIQSHQDFRLLRPGSSDHVLDIERYRYDRNTPWHSFRSHAFVEVLQHEKRLLLRAVFPDQSFAVPSVLHMGERTSGRAEIRQYPRRSAAPLRYALEHGNGLSIQIFLVFLAEAGEPVSVEALQCIGTELADDDRLLI